MSSLVLGLHEIEKTQLSLVGGKGLHLGELSKIQGIQVPTRRILCHNSRISKSHRTKRNVTSVVGSVGDAKS